MKKLLCIFISIILCFSFGMTAFAEEDDTAPSDTQSASQPRLMVESYTLSKPDLKPNESATLEIKLKNHSLKKNINNIAITLSDEANEISTIGVNSGYIDKIIPNSRAAGSILLNFKRVLITSCFLFSYISSI